MTVTHDPFGPTVDDLGLIQPQNIEAEQSVIGALMLSPKLIPTVNAILATADFWRPAHQTIYNAITHMAADSRDPRIDTVTVAANLQDNGELARVGGVPYLHTCVNAVPVAANAEYYAEIIRECAQLRTIIEATRRATLRAYGADGTAAEILDTAMDELQAAASGTTTTDVKLSVAERWLGFIGELEAGHDPRALDTPWPDLNDVIELKPGQLITVGAATGAGKSILGMNLASHVALTHGRPTLVASMEMGGSELMARLTAAEAGVNLDRLIRRRLQDADWQRIMRASDRMQNATNFILDDSPNLTVGKIRARLRWMASRNAPAAMVVADYLQLMTPDTNAHQGNRTQEVAQISRGLKLLAMEFEIPVVALAQFNRGATGRQPLVTDFKDSSAIEQDSNVILLMHRPLADDGTDTGPRAGEVDVVVAKNRNGASGRIVQLSFQGHYGRLRSMAGN